MVTDGVEAGAANVECRTRGGVFVIGNPLDEVGHDLLVVNLSVCEALQGGEGHTGVIRPRARGDGIGAVARHIGHGQSGQASRQ